MDNKIVHHYLHEQAFGTVVAERIDTGNVICRFPWEPERYSAYKLAVDERDQRTLVVFDGELLFGGLPRSATVITSPHSHSLYRSSASIRKKPEYPCVAWPNYLKDDEDDPETVIEISRHFLLLPSCTAIARKFRDKSLSPIYVIINVSVNAKGTRVVEWQTTSY